MGSGRDKRKKAKGSSTAGHGATKTLEKTQKNAAKLDRREASDFAGGEDDIDAILAQLNKTNIAKSAVTVTNNVPAPSPRVNGVFLPTNDQKMEEIIMFGGEMLDAKTDKLYMYDDLYKYNVAKDKWTHIKCPGPHPRSSCCAAVHRGFLYIFGGEFTSLNQNKFKHFRDLWRLDLATWEWDELKSKKGPTARSGHRMVAHKGRLIMFGGYYDTGDEPRYYKDLWQFDVDALAWSPLGNMSEKWPPARSGFQFAMHGEELILQGGYSKHKSDDEDDMEHGQAFDDTWRLRLDTHKWERIAKAGMAPSKRASFSLAVHKDKAIMFGGVADEEAKQGEVIVSNFFNELYQLNMTQMRWYPIALRPAKQDADDAASSIARLGQQTVVKDADADPAAARLHAAAQRIQAHYRGHVVRKAFKLYKIGGTISEVLYSPAAYGVDLSSRNAPKPRARINAGMCVVKNHMFLFGGIVEIGDEEVTLDDMWKLDLNKLNGWTCVKDNTAGAEDFMKKEGSDWETDDDEDEEDDLAALPKMSAGKRPKA